MHFAEKKDLAQKDMFSHAYLIADPFNNTYNMGRHMTDKQRKVYKNEM